MATSHLANTRKSNGITRTSEDLEQIRKDINSLQSSLASLTQHFTEDTGEQAEAIKKSLLHRYTDIKKNGAAEYEKLEQRVRDNPGRSLLLAAAIGVVAASVLARK